MELNALERFLEDDFTKPPGLTFSDLRAFAKEHRELEERFRERGDLGGGGK